MGRGTFDYTKKQAGVIYRAWKEGKVAADRETIDALYRLAEEGQNEGVGNLRKQHLNDAVENAVGWIADRRSDYGKAQFWIDQFAARCTDEREERYWAGLRKRGGLQAA